MSKDEYVYVNEQRHQYIEMIMLKYPGMAGREKRKRYYDKLSAWSQNADVLYHTQAPRTFPHGPDFQPITIEQNQTWELSRI